MDHSSWVFLRDVARKTSRSPESKKTGGTPNLSQGYPRIELTHQIIRGLVTTHPEHSDALPLGHLAIGVSHEDTKNSGSSCIRDVHDLVHKTPPDGRWFRVPTDRTSS